MNRLRNWWKRMPREKKYLLIDGLKRTYYQLIITFSLFIIALGIRYLWLLKQSTILSLFGNNIINVKVYIYIKMSTEERIYSIVREEVKDFDKLSNTKKDRILNRTLAKMRSKPYLS